MTRPTLIIMLKEPCAGRVKTRLGKDIGLTAAAWWFRQPVKRLLRRLDEEGELVRGPPEEVHEEQNHDDERDGSHAASPTLLPLLFPIIIIIIKKSLSG